MARIALVALLALPAAAHAQAPAASSVVVPAASVPPTSPTGSAAHDTGGGCDDATRAWAERASKRTGLAITAVACPSGVVRLEVAGAGCDFEVRRDGGFKRTADGKLGVSPIANLEWEVAPEPMKEALAGLLSALAEDPSLPIPTGAVRYRADGEVAGGAKGLGSRRTQMIAFAGVMAALGALAFGLRRLRKRKPPSPSPPAPPAA